MYTPINFRDSVGNSNIFIEQTVNGNTHVTKVESETTIGTPINVTNMNNMEDGIYQMHQNAEIVRADARKQLKMISFLRWELSVLSGNPSVSTGKSIWFSFNNASEINLISGSISEFGFGL